MLSSEVVLGDNDPSPICRLVNSVLFCLTLQRHFTNITGNVLLPACPANKASPVEKELVGKMPATTEVFQYQAGIQRTGTRWRDLPRGGGAIGKNTAAILPWRDGAIRCGFLEAG